MHRAHARYAAEGDSDAALVTRHAALIDRAARRVAARTAGVVSAEDLWSAGAMGLIEAARRFDGARDVKFETFAAHRIQGAMIDELRRLDHLPRRLRAQAEEVERARARLGHQLQREPTTEELSLEVGLEGEELSAVMGVAQPTPAVLEAVESPAVPADEQVERRQLLGAVAGAVAELPERLQLLLSLHYVEGLTYREIAKVLAVSEPRVCQLHGEAMALLRRVAGPGAP
ncbi:sigma-70 family RNA polymerase sigma factor [Anaeromyxobacter diazotrophicus]|uniref:RNA polymerase sigma factor FliA n=1 Tax=Anaeromyxobacter diazotrophicus TaxID=2590199 RepID=A0A7I9VSX5_9BACT|nr:sigma-70 family RNA polymerase sigma factor [Anaeromyxobacter diazotrophicus]GEJ59189.1 RNA polymerase sigma factor FliA [Anaeromyxobacter diazotrophicus]